MKKSFFTKHLLLTAVMATALQFLCIHALLPIMVTGDDYLAEISIGGAYNGMGVSFYPFFNSVLVRALGFVYSLCPAVPWLAILMESILIFSCIVFQYCTFCVADRNQIPLWNAELLYLCFFFITIFTISLPLSFTLISGIGGAAAACLVLASFLLEKHVAPSLCVSVLLLWICYALRPQSALVTICFWGLNVVVFSILLPLTDGSPAAKKGKRILLGVVIMSVAFAGCFALFRANQVLKDTPDAAMILRWNNARSEQIDFHEADYQNDSRFYNSIGWNEEFYNLEESWYLLDEKCDYEHYKDIHRYASAKSVLTDAQPLVLSTVSKMVKAVFSFTKSIYFFPLIALLGALFLLCVWLGVRRWRAGGWLYCLFAVCALGGTVLMWLYLTYIGRFIGRVFRLTCLPAISCLFLTNLYLIRPPARRGPKLLFPFATAAAFLLILLMALPQVYEKLPVLLVVTVLLAGALLSVCVVYTGKNLGSRLFALILTLSTAFAVMLSVLTTVADVSEFVTRQKKFIAEQRYASEHTDSVFVSSREYTPVQADLIYGTCTDKTNLFYTVDYLMFSDAYSEKLERVGLDALNIDSYFTDNVYYIGNSDDDTTVTLLLDYMRTQYGDGVRAEVCEELDGGVAVYRFVK